MKRWIPLLITILFLQACSDSDDDAVTSSSDDFDRKAMLENWADNRIIPAYEDLNTKLGSMVEAKDDFVNNPNEVNLEAVRIAWLDAYKVWQHVEMFSIGRAEQINYAFQMNVYPTNVDDIQSNIQTQNYDLSSVNNHDAVGFPALDYMLYGVGNSKADVISYYITDANLNLNYLSDLVDRMKSLTQSIVDDWKNGYRDDFVNNTENSATGSINKLVNDYIFYYEKGLRANKIGIPAGNFSNEPFPDKVEAYYHGSGSKVLALEGLTAVQEFLNGVAYNSTNDGRGLADYLDALDINATEEALSTAINNQFDDARNAIQPLDDSFADQVQNNNNMMFEAYDQLQLAVVLLKVDMLQALDISVDFVDADGD